MQQREHPNHASHATADAAASAAGNLPVILIGAGGHARVLINALRLQGTAMLFITDSDPSRHGSRIEGVEVKGGDEHVLEHPPDTVLLVNAVGSTNIPTAREAVFKAFKARGYRFATVIHPAATLADGTRLGEGVQLMAGVVVQPGVTVANNSLINTRASIDHDCRIGRHCHISPGVTLSGNVSVGSTCHIGTSATVIQGVTIGNRVLIGAGSVVLRNVPDGGVVWGVPAKPRQRRGEQATHAAAGPADSTPAAVDTCNIMLSAAGRRVALMHLLEQSLDGQLAIGRVVASDITEMSAAYHAARHACIVPRYNMPDCLDVLLERCREHQIRLIIPTIDPDLPFYAEHRQAFADIGTTIMVSDMQTVLLGNDKQACHDWLIRNGFPTVEQLPAEQYLQNPPDWPFPLFVKPRHGSSSIGASIVRDMQQLRYAAGEGDYLVQTVALGREYTVDVYVDRRGKCRCAVPRLRIETRGGEVTKGMTVRHEAIQDLARRVAEALPGVWGVMNIQIFYDEKTDRLNLIEINPRFGGGYPLTYAAGAQMTRWIIEETLGQPCTATWDGWQDELLMIRYDEAVFVCQ